MSQSSFKYFILQKQLLLTSPGTTAHSQPWREHDGSSRAGNGVWSQQVPGGQSGSWGPSRFLGAKQVPGDQQKLTICRRQMFSRREPTQPQKVMRNIRTPTAISSMAGSTDRQAMAVSGEKGEEQMRRTYKKNRPEEDTRRLGEICQSL